MAEKKLPKVTIYTDGGCRPNPGPGGWGAVILYPRRKPIELSGRDEHTTNNRMELTAAIEAIQSLEGSHSVELVTDSEYLRRGITQWLAGWRTRGWLTAQKTPVKNRDLWQQLDAALAGHDVRWRWTPGHSGSRWNERADRLASRAIGPQALPLDDDEAVHLFTGVAFSGKRQLGSWAVLLRFGKHWKEGLGKVPGTTANRLHILAAVEGLSLLRRGTRVNVYTVSSYLADGARQWVPGWKRRGWLTRDGSPVKHRDLWEKLDRLGHRHEILWHVLDETTAPEELITAKELAQQALAEE